MTTALEMAERLRRREVTSVELVRQSIDKIRTRDGELGAFIEVAARRALMQARRADLLRARGSKLPFLGVPTAIKDHEPVRGLGTRIGSRAFRWLVSPIDGYVARACRRAGTRQLCRRGHIQLRREGHPTRRANASDKRIQRVHRQRVE